MTPSDGIIKTNISLKMLIDSGILNEGQEIFCRNPNIKGIINNDGSITLDINDKKMAFGYLSGAARFIEKISLNGWLYWHVIHNNEKQPIGIFRDEYLKNHVSSKSN
jgi:Restriction Enzyme Adenine Methylase Associated